MRPTMVIHKSLALVITVTQSMGSKPRQIFLFTSSQTIFLLQPHIVSHNHFSTLLSHLTQNQLTSFTYLTQKYHFLNFTVTILTFTLTIFNNLSYCSHTKSSFTRLFNHISFTQFLCHNSFMQPSVPKHIISNSYIRDRIGMDWVD